MSGTRVFRILAYASYYLFTFQVFSVHSAYSADADPIAAANAFNTISSIFSVASLFLCALLHARIERFLRNPLVVILSGVACGMSNMLAGFTQTADAAFYAVVTASALLSGVGTTILFFSIVLIFFDEDPQKGAFEVIVAFSINILATAAIAVASSFILLATGTFLPVLTAAFVVLSAKRKHKEPTEVLKDDDKRSVMTLLTKLAVFVAIMSFMHGTVRNIYQAAGNQITYVFSLVTIIGLVVVCILVFITCWSSRQVHCTDLVRILLFSFIAVYAFMFLFSADYSIAYALRCIVGRLLRDVLFIMCLRVCLSTALPPLQVFGYLFALSKVATLAAQYIAGSFLAGVDINVFVSFSIVIVTFTAMFVFNTGDVKRLMHTSHTRPTEDLSGIKADILAHKYGLTDREREVVLLYCQGNSARKIAEEMLLSENTIGTYRRKAYDKIGVHSKQDLIDLFASTEVKY